MRGNFSHILRDSSKEDRDEEKERDRGTERESRLFFAVHISRSGLADEGATDGSEENGGNCYQLLSADRLGFLHCETRERRFVG